MSRKSAGNIQMSDGSVTAPDLPAMGRTRLERMEAGLQMLKEWHADCIAICAANEDAVGYTMQMVFTNIGKDVDLAISNLEGVVRNERAMNPPEKQKPVKLKKNKHRRKFLKRPIVPPHYNGILVSMTDMTDHKQCSRENVYYLMKTGRLPQTYRFGKKTVWLLKDLEEAMRVPVAWKRKEPMK